MPSKTQHRTELRTVRDAISPGDRARKSVRACHAAAALLSEFRCVAVYNAMRSELCPSTLEGTLLASGTTVAYPRVFAGAHALSFYAAQKPQDFVLSSLGILEPRVGLPPLPLSAIDAFIVPGLGFDASGQRLGWGRGYYDYTLAQCPNATRVGICFQEQIVASLPCEDTDVPMHLVVTDVNHYKVGALPTRAPQREPS